MLKDLVKREEIVVLASQAENMDEIEIIEYDPDHLIHGRVSSKDWRMEELRKAIELIKH